MKQWIYYIYSSCIYDGYIIVMVASFGTVAKTFTKLEWWIMDGNSEGVSIFPGREERQAAC